MARIQATESLKVFRKNVERTAGFLRIFDRKTDGGRSRGRPRTDELELLRGSVVFAVGAVDAYLHDLILEIVPTYRPTSPEMIGALKEIAKDDAGLALRVALARTPEESRIEFTDALSNWLERKSFQGPANVKSALKYIGSPLTWQDFDTASGQNAATQFEKMTTQRHQMVHRGSKPQIDRRAAAASLDLASDIVECIDRDVRARYL